jgi:hypothetical protein
MSDLFRLHRAISIGFLCILIPLLSGCAATSAFVADTMPTWMGGLPEGAPPRPSDPRYAEYERQQQEKAAAPKTAAAPAKTDATPAPAK